MKNFTFLIITAFLFLLAPTMAENEPSDSIKSLIADLRKKAITFDKRKDVYNAIDCYGRYLLYKNKDIKLMYRLSILYFEVREYAKTYQYCDSVIKLSKSRFPLVYYKKGLVCLNLQKYDEAIDMFTKFRKMYKKSDDENNYRKLAAIYSEKALWAKSQSESGANISITHLQGSINHASIDFAPYPVNENTIVYGAVYADASKNINPVRQIYKAVKIDGEWKNLGLLNGEINDPGYNTGNAVVSDDGKRMFFTRLRKNWKNEDVCELFESHYDGDKWGAPEKLPYPINNENYTSTQPSVGRNLRNGNLILYFVSNRPGGKGGLDIWFSEYDSKTDTYREPQDLDKGVNSVGDDCCPFYDFTTRTLYFSSNGRPNGFGGFDIYKAVGSARKWTDAVPMPKPVNSSFDDYYFTILKNNKEGYFTSNRPGSMALASGGCCDDIFSFRINECTLISTSGTVRNFDNDEIYISLNRKYHLGLQYPETNILLPDVPVELYLAGEKEGEEIFISKTTTDQDGKYHFDLESDKQYKILVKNYGYFEKRLTVNTAGVKCSDTINVPVTHINYLPRFNVRLNIYYDYDKFKLTDEARQIIDTTLMPLFDLFPNAIVEIGSHTDNTGSEEYNMKLSQKRSESVVNYLISRGVLAERLVAKGYGMSSPIAQNTNADGSDNPSGRQLNRRTEIKIVGDISNFIQDK